MRPYVVSRQESSFPAANNIWIRRDFGLDDCPPPAIVCIPDFFIDPTDRNFAGYPEEAAWLTRVYAGGATLASACSGAVLLAETGLLAGREATIHWGYSDFLRNNYKGINVRPERALVLSGEAHRIIMAGGGTNWQDLALYLIGRHCGLSTAIEVAKTYLLGWHDMGQQPYASLFMSRQSDDGVVIKAQEWLAYNYTSHAPVAKLVELSGLSERTFSRRFLASTGMSPIAYVHALRLEEAKQMLETTDEPVDAIAEQSGYEDTSFFTRLFKKHVGVTPAQYRKRFGVLRQILG
jgi:transcriptional regulator GlxA family with amidase domain